jgi:hypothetical protein
MLLASLYSPEGGWLKRVAGTLLQGVTAGMLDAPNFAPVTGYIAFFTLALYVAGLILLAFAVNGETSETLIITHPVVEEYRQLTAAERLAVREAILDDEPFKQGSNDEEQLMN